MKMMCLESGMSCTWGVFNSTKIIRSERKIFPREPEICEATRFLVLFQSLIRTIGSYEKNSIELFMTSNWLTIFLIQLDLLCKMMINESMNLIVFPVNNWFLKLLTTFFAVNNFWTHSLNTKDMLNLRPSLNTLRINRAELKMAHEMKIFSREWKCTREIIDSQLSFE